MIKCICIFNKFSSLDFVKSVSLCKKVWKNLFYKLAPSYLKVFKQNRKVFPFGIWNIWEKRVSYECTDLLKINNLFRFSEMFYFIWPSIKWSFLSEKVSFTFSSFNSEYWGSVLESKSEKIIVRMHHFCSLIKRSQLLFLE